MRIDVFSIPGCDYCKKVKKLLDKYELPYIQTVVGKDLSKDRFMKMYPAAAGFPLVVIDGKAIGGLVPTAKYLLDEKIIVRDSVTKRHGRNELDSRKGD